VTPEIAILALVVGLVAVVLTVAWWFGIAKEQAGESKAHVDQAKQLSDANKRRQEMLARGKSSPRELLARLRKRANSSNPGPM